MERWAKTWKIIKKKKKFGCCFKNLITSIIYSWFAVWLSTMDSRHNKSWFKYIIYWMYINNNNNELQFIIH